MKFIIENYLIFVLVGSFLVFALIGYIIDLVRKNNKEANENNTIPTGVNNIEQSLTTTDNNQLVENNINSNTNQPTESLNIPNMNNNSKDDLLNSYNDINNV